MTAQNQTNMKRVTALVLTVLTLATVPVSQATLVIRLSVAQQVDNADLIFIGTALQEEVMLSRDGKFPFTFVTFAVEEILKGATVESFLTLRLAGGRIGRRTTEVEGMPEFQRGERYLLFVAQNGQASCPLLGWGQGVMQFTRDSQTGATVLTDERGAPLLGIQGNIWRRGAPQFAPKAGLVYSNIPEAQVIDDRGINGPSRIAPWLNSEGAAQAEGPITPVSVEQVVAQLRAFISQRQGTARFYIAPPVRSTLPSEVPESMRGAPVPFTR